MANGKKQEWDYANNRPMEPLRTPEDRAYADAGIMPLKEYIEMPGCAPPVEIPIEQAEGPVIRCGKYELRELPDGLIEVREPGDDGISFVLSDAAIDGFMFAGQFLLDQAPPTE